MKKEATFSSNHTLMYKIATVMCKMKTKYTKKTTSPKTLEFENATSDQQNVSKCNNIATSIFGA